MQSNKLTLRREAQELMQLYPRIFFACHTRHRRGPATRKELTAHQASLLDHLHADEPTSLHQLARHMGVTPATMSVNVERLVRGGYVVRERDPEDRRQVQLRLTAAGVRVQQGQQVLDPERVLALLRRLSPAQRREGLRGLALLARAAEEELQSRWGDGSPSSAEPTDH